MKSEIQMTNAESAISRLPFVILISSFVIFQWGVKDLNLRRHCHQIYSLTPLTTRETPLANPLFSGLLMRRPRPDETRFEQYSAKKQGGVFVQASGGT